MLFVSLLAAGMLLAPQVGAHDGRDDERALLRQALVVLGERPLSDEMVSAYTALHGRAWRLGDVETAHAAIDRIVVWWELQYGDQPVALANLLNRLGADGLMVARDFAAARPLLERVLALRESALGPDHLDVAKALNNLGVIHNRLGDAAAARRMQERALAIREAALGSDHPLVARSLLNLSTALEALGDLEAARSVSERALQLTQASLDPDHPEIVASLINLANLYSHLGDHAAARPLLESALTIQQRALDPDQPDLAVTLFSLGVVHDEQGDEALARQHYERAMALWEASFGPQYPRIALCLENLGLLLQEAGDSAGARPFLERALAIQEATVGRDHPDVARIVNKLGFVHAGLGDHATARRMHERGLRIRESALGPEHPDVAESLNGLGQLLADLGDHAAARPLYERDLEIMESALGPEHPRVVWSLYTLTLLHLDAEMPEAAFACARRLAKGREQMRRNMASLTPGESYRFVAEYHWRLNSLLAASRAVGDLTAAYGAVLDAKGQVARLTLQTRAQIRDSLDAETLARMEKLGRLQARLSRLALQTDVRDREAHDEQLESLRAERDALDRALRRTTSLRADSVHTPQAVAAALPEGSAFVDLLVHKAYVPARFEDGALVATGSWSEPRLSAWVLRPGSDGVSHVDLGPVAPIEAALDEHLADLIGSDDARGGRLKTARPRRGASQVLRALVWEPLRRLLDGASTVFVSPDGALGKLPFETLQQEAGSFLIEEYAFIYVPNASKLVELGEAARPLGTSLLAVGGVNYDRSERPSSPAPDPSMRSRGEMSRGFASGWSRLPATLEEAHAIVEAHRQAVAGGSAGLLIGAEATEERIKAELPRHAVVHLATHGFFQPEGLPSMLELAGDLVSGERGSMRRTDTSGRLTGLHPGLLSGLVLAGVNGPPADDVIDSDGRDDGYLTASEVTLLDLGDVDLVVLSACETGLGRPQTGEGMLGLRRAFHMAGADTVVSSLWAVGDESTRELMQSFYSNLFLEGMGRHEALRTAQLDMLAKNRVEHGEALPSTWGAFVLSGEWR